MDFQKLTLAIVFALAAIGAIWFNLWRRKKFKIEFDERQIMPSDVRAWGLVVVFSVSSIVLFVKSIQ